MEERARKNRDVKRVKRGIKSEGKVLEVKTEGTL